MKLSIPLLLLCLLGIYTTAPVHAERVPAIVYKDRAYLFGKPQQLLAADVGRTQASPSGRYLLAISKNPPKEMFDAIIYKPARENPVVELYLYDAVRRRTVSLWKARDDENENWYGNSISWLADGETALVTVRHSMRIEDAVDASGNAKPQYAYTTELLLVNAARHTARTLPLGDTPGANLDVGISPSPTRNEAMIVYRAENNKPYTIRLIAGNGVLSVPILLPSTYLIESGWNKEGTQWVQFGSRSADKANPAPEGYTTAYTVFNRVTKTASEGHEKPEWFKDDLSDLPKEPESFLVVQSHPSSASWGTSRQDTRVLFVQTEDGKDKTTLALDASEVGVLGDKENPVVIYESKNALYSIPVYAVAYADYVTFARREIKANALQLLSCIKQWMKDNAADALPSSADPIALFVGKYIVQDYPFRDPHTGQMAFKNVFNGKADSTGNVPLFTLTTSVGTLTMYSGEKGVQWGN